MQIQHSKENHKFYTEIDGRESHLMYDEVDGALDLKHTVVSEPDRGKGIAEELVLESFSYAEKNQLKIIPSCSYVEKYIEKHPKWKKLTRSKDVKEKLEVYWPVILLVLYGLAGAVIFAITARGGTVGFMHYFMGFFLAGFSFFKLLDLDGFANAYKEYDLIAKRYPAYARAYPLLELFLAVLYLSFFLPTVTYALTFVIMVVSSIGVIQAVMKGKDIKCGCMGTLFDLPMSTVTIVEDVSMAVMAFLMLTMS